MATGLPAVQLQDGVLCVEYPALNGTGEAWRGADGWAVGYHLFDEPTGALVVDGERTAIDLAPSESREVPLAIALPPEPGTYNIFVSVMREHVAWFYERGWPFLLIDVEVDESGGARVAGWRITDRRAVARRRLMRSLTRMFTLPTISIWRNRSLIRTMVRRDVLSRYTGSFGGAFWTVLNPLLLLVTYFFVFGLVLGQRFGGDTSRAGYAVYLLAGMLPWLAFSEAVGRSPFLLVEHRSFIRKLVFPVETLPVNLVVSGLVTEFFGAILFVLALLLLRGGVAPTVMLMPLLVIPQILLTAGLCWFLAALGVFARDLTQIIGYLLTIWYFLTPICYPEASWNALPALARRLLALNPIYVLVRAYRAVLLESRAPDWNAMAWLTVVSVAVFLVGHAWFYKLRKSFADLI